MLKSAVPSVTDQLNYFPLTVGGTILISLLLAAVVECCVSLLMRLAADASAPPRRQGVNRRHSSGIG